eukprot:3836461-Amphidinium_carterae.1
MIWRAKKGSVCTAASVDRLYTEYFGAFCKVLVCCRQSMKGTPRSRFHLLIDCIKFGHKLTIQAKACGTPRLCGPTCFGVWVYSKVFRLYQTIWIVETQPCSNQEHQHRCCRLVVQPLAKMRRNHLLQQ